MKLFGAIKLYAKRVFRRLRYVFMWNSIWARRQKQSCDRCGQFQWIDFTVRDGLWLRVVGSKPGPCLCLNCFLEIATDKDIRLELGDLPLVFVMGEKHGGLYLVRAGR